MTFPTQPIPPRREPPNLTALEPLKAKLLLMGFEHTRCQIGIPSGNDAGQLYSRVYYEPGHNAQLQLGIHIFVTETALHLIHHDEWDAPAAPRPLTNAIKRCGVSPIDMFSRLYGSGPDGLELEFIAEMDDFMATYHPADAPAVVNTILEYLAQ